MSNRDDRNPVDEYQIGSSVYGVRDAKAHLSRLLREVKSGREVVITEHGRPIARVTPIKVLTLEQQIAAEGCRPLASVNSTDSQERVSPRTYHADLRHKTWRSSAKRRADLVFRVT